MTYPRSFKVPLYGVLKDDRPVIYGENASDVVWTLACDADRDQPTAVGKGDRGTFHLQRVQK